MTLLFCAVLVLGAGTALAETTTDDPDAPFVWATDPLNGEILLIDEEGASPVYLSDPEVDFSDIVYGPDELLYACAPSAGLIIRFVPEVIEPEEPEDDCFDDCLGGCVEECPSDCATSCGDDVGECYTECLECPEYCETDCEYWCEFGGEGFTADLVDPDDVLYEYDVALPGPVAPECGWFTHKGGLVVTDTFVPDGGTPSNGVWIFPDEDDDYDGCMADMPCLLVSPSDLPAGFVGGGVTQAANGDLLIVDQGNGQVLSVPYDLMDGFLTDEVEPIIGPLTAPIGIARLSTGEIFVTSGNQIQGFELAAEPGDEVKDWDSFCSADFFYGEDCSGYPRFVEVTANDWLYVATVDACEEIPAIEVGEDEVIVGGSLWAIDSDCMVYEIEDEGGEDFVVDAPPLFTYDDGTLSGVALPPTSRTIELAYDADGSGDLVFDFSDHIYEVTAANSCDANNTAFETPPACIQSLIPFNPDFAAEPVIYLGEGGFPTAYNLTTPSVEGETCQPPGDVFFHAVSAYTDLLQNPTIVRCEDPGQVIGNLEDICSWPVSSCEYLDLASFFPFDGNLPDDGRIGSRGRASFSLYFLVDYGLSNDGEGAGAWCGFRRPLNTVSTPEDPSMSVFREGRTVPLKFKVKADGGNCNKGPFIAPEGILLSIARVEPDFAVQEIVCVGGGCGEVPFFDAPNNPKKGYHMNIRTDGFEPGIYQAVLIATGGEFPLSFTYFEIR